MEAPDYIARSQYIADLKESVIFDYSLIETGKYKVYLSF